MIQPRETKPNPDIPQYSKLFKEASIFSKNQGDKALLEYLMIITNKKEVDLNSTNTLVNISELIAVCIDRYGVDFTYLILKSNQTKITNFDISNKKELYEKAVSIVCGVFMTTKESILEMNKRNGVRIYASGTLFNLLCDILGYSIDEVVEITKKERSAVSRHKNAVKNLDPNHRLDRKFIIKYIESKKQLIKHIINGKQGE
jgi:hypothetical protein